jgi:hypothetical protein
MERKLESRGVEHNWYIHSPRGPSGAMGSFLFKIKSMANAKTRI